MIKTRPLLFNLLLFCIILIAYFDAALPSSGYMARVQGPMDRFFARFLLSFNLLIIIFFTYQVQFKLSKSPFLFNKFLLFFFGFVLLCNIFSFDYYWLARVSYTLLLFFPFYYAGYKNFLKTNGFYVFGLALLTVYLYGFFIGLGMRATLSNNFFSIADNVGYYFLSLFIYFCMKPSKSFNYYFLAFIFIVICFTFKRGAILCAAVGYSAFIVFNLPNIKKKKFLIFGLLLSCVLLYYVFEQFQDMILYRFLDDDALTGSGRDKMYKKIYEVWVGSGVFHIFFGLGFFSVKETLHGFFAHSDWFELMHDHGIAGLSIYTMLILSFISLRKNLPRDLRPAFITIVSVWLLKSIFSGVYMDRGFALFFACIGLLLGTAHRQILLKTVGQATP